MIHCSLKDLYRFRYVLLWMVLSFKAGFINASGFLATGRFVSHVTGFGTQAGVSLAHEDYFFGIELLIVPITFILGSMVPALILDRNYSENKVPPYPIVQLIITCMLVGIAVTGSLGWFGEFSTLADDAHDIALIGILCFVCGMKNGLTTWASYGKIRTTHITGLATDIGLNLPKLFRGKSPSRFPESYRVNNVRVATLVSFTVGSLAAAFSLPKLGYLGFFIPAVISLGLLTISVLSYRKAIRQERPGEVNARLRAV